MSDFCVVIPTLGRTETLDVALAALESQSLKPLEIIIVFQGEARVYEELVAKYRSENVVVIGADKGLARARNAGLNACSCHSEFVMFMDDDIKPAPNFLEVAAVQLSTHHFASGRLTFEGTNESRLRFPKTPTPITAKNVWNTAIEATCVYRRLPLEVVGGFNEALGLGSGTRFGSGEGTDLLLRLLKNGMHGIYSPNAMAEEIVFEEVVPSNAQDVERVRSYAIGAGFVVGSHYGLAYQFWFVLKALLRLVSDAPRGNWRRRIAVLVGRVEGVLSAKKHQRQPEIK